MRFVRDSLLTIAVLAMLAVPAGASAASPNEIIRDCSQDGDFDREYSQGDLRRAEGRLPTDVDEYTDCRDVINRAQTRNRSRRGGDDGGAGGGGAGSASGGGDGGAVAASPDDAKELEKAARDADAGDAPTLSVDGERIEPGEGGVLQTATAANSLPVPILLVLIAVAALCAAGGYAVLRRRFPEARSAALRLFRR